MPSTASDKIFALVDCNSFYCSCERVFQPKLQNKPVIVLSNNDGCAVARSDEAKAVGIQMGDPFFKIKDLVKKHDVKVFSSNYSLYGDMSRRVMQTLALFSPDMEVYSIDEAFLSFKGFERRNLTEYALQIKEKVYQDTGIPVSIGIGPTKVLAKAANKLSKKNKILTKGVFDIRDPLVQEKALRSFPAEDIWGIGRKSSQKLLNYNIKTALDLRNANEQFIQKLLTIVGRRILQELRGESCLDLEDIKNKKQIISSRSFGRPVTSLQELQEATANHITNACEKLRRQKSATQSLSVFIQTNPFKNTPQYFNSAHATLLSSTCVTNKLIHKAFELLSSIYEKGFEYKKVGVILSSIHPQGSSQLDLFSNFDTPQEINLMRAIDSINEREGKNTVKFAACGIHQFWKMLSQMKTPAYTTRASEFLQVKI